ncbi:RHS repeat-associated core domain-containing protein, partial [Pedobacter sp. HMF7056]|nr:RHS repeat-associated core domain-containing protein [Hufsiella ginkgonis]
QGAPGDPWQPYSTSISGSGHTAKTEYGTNSASGDRSVRLWKAEEVSTSGQEHKRHLTTAGNYDASQLYLAISKDENWASGNAGTVEEYKDKEGRIVLKRAWKDESVKLSTYYIYDDLGNLSFVLPPGADPDGSSISQTSLDGFCYQYRYDGRNRLIEKRIPGKGWDYLVYNKLDQLVMTQDSVQRDNGKWLFSKYDVMGRNILTGIASSSSSRDTWQSSVNAQSALWETRDDANTSGTGTGYSNASLPTSGIDRYHTVSYFDDYGFYGNSFGAPG